MNESEQRPSGSQWKSVSNEEEGREARRGMANKRRGVKTSATRANVFRDATKKTEEGRRKTTGLSGVTNKNNVKLSFKETMLPT